MAIDRDPKYRERVVRGKYQRLYAYLSGLQTQEWRASFREIESALGFDLPASARLHRPWWANQRSGRWPQSCSCLGCRRMGDGRGRHGF